MLTISLHRSAYACSRLVKEYFKGNNVSQSYVKAAQWFERAAQDGNQYAQYMLGKVYLMGQGVEYDRDRGIHWLTKSAYQGNAYADALLNRQNNNLPPNVFLGITRLLHHMGRIFQDNSLPQSRPGGIQIDRKRMRALQEKRQAQGRKGHVYEEYNGPTMSIWLMECAEPTVRPTTIKGYRGYVEKNLKPYLGNKQICKVTTAEIQSLYRKLQKEGAVNGGPLAGTTVRRIHNVLHQALDVAVNRHLIVKNPSNDVTLPKKVATAKTILNDEQLERFMEAIKADEHWHDFFYLEITTGLRQGELCGLMWTDFDEKKGTLTIRRTLHRKDGGGYYVGDTKTGTGRRNIKLPPSTVQLLLERKKKSISQWIFHNPIRPEDPVMPNSGYHRMKKIMKDAGLPNMRFHDLRHTFATHALTSGVDAKTLSGILGHTKTSFTLDTYTHVTGDMHRKASEIVGGFMEDFMVRE